MTPLLKSCEIKTVEPLAAAGTGALTSDIVDARDRESVLFLCPLGPVVEGSVVALKVYQSDAAAMGTEEEITGASAGFTGAAAGADDNSLLAVEVIQPKKRYLRAKLTRTTQNTTVGGIIAVIGNSRTEPLTGTFKASAIAGPIAAAV